MRSLEGHYLRNQLRNLRLFGHVASLLERLGAEAIDVIVLKGAYLAQSVYADPAVRAMADADLLIRDATSNAPRKRCVRWVVARGLCACQ